MLTTAYSSCGGDGEQPRSTVSPRNSGTVAQLHLRHNLKVENLVPKNWNSFSKDSTRQKMSGASIEGGLAAVKFSHIDLPYQRQDKLDLPASIHNRGIACLAPLADYL